MRVMMNNILHIILYYNNNYIRYNIILSVLYNKYILNK